MKIGDKNELSQYIDKTCSEYDSDILLLLFFIHHCFVSKNDIDKLDLDISPVIIEWLAYYASCYFGNCDNKPDLDVLDSIVRDINKLFQISMFEILSAKSGVDEVDEIVNYANWRINLSRSSANEFQLSILIQDILFPFCTEFRIGLGIDPKKLLFFFGMLYHHNTLVMNHYINNTDLYTEDDLLEAIPIDIKRAKSLGFKITKNEFTSIITLFGLNKEKRMTLNSPIEVRNWPIIVLPQDRIFTAFHSHLLRIFFEKYNDFASTSVFKKSYIEHRGNWLELKTKEYLERIFPKESIYHKLLYLNPDRKDDTDAEIDLVVFFDPFLLLIECKSGSFDIRSFNGDGVRLKSDIDKIFEDAFKQSKRAARYINENDRVIFREKYTGRTLEIEGSKIAKVYHCTIFLTDEIGLAARLASCVPLGLFTNNEFPFSICITDLDIITMYCRYPDAFLHFIERILKITNTDKLFCLDIIDLFGYYLTDRLYQIEESLKDKKFDIVHAGTNTSKLDNIYYHDLGLDVEKPEITLELPPLIIRMLDTIRPRDTRDSRYIAFEILNMTNEELWEIHNRILDVLNRTIPEHVIRYSVFNSEDTVISILCASNTNDENLYIKTIHRAKIEKYRRKCSKSIGISAFIIDKEVTFEHLVYIEEVWKYNRKLEKAIEEEPLITLAPKQKMPGRNDKCICGSGKKFKKCCWDKYYH